MLAVIAGIIICFNSIISLRVPDIIVDARMGTATTAGTVLSLMQLTGIVAGVGFASLTHVFKKELAHDHVLWFRSGFGLDWLVQPAMELGYRNPFSRIYLTVRGSPVSFITYLKKIPTNLLNLATSLVLIGCNLGSALSSFFIQLVTPLALTIICFFVWIGALMVGTGVFASQLLARTKWWRNHFVFFNSIYCVLSLARVIIGGVWKKRLV